MQWHPGEGVGIGKDFTLYATVPGIVVYQESKYIRKVQHCSTCLCVLVDHFCCIV